MIDTNEMRRLTQAATPGQWWVNRDGLNRGFARGVMEINANDWHAFAGTWAVNGEKHSDEGVANAEFIAAANPATINELLDRLEAAEKEREELRAVARHESDCVEAAKAEIKALQAKVAEMEKRLRLILEEPENTMSNSKAMREMLKQARLALKESK